MASAGQDQLRAATAHWIQKTVLALEHNREQPGMKVEGVWGNKWRAKNNKRVKMEINYEKE